MEEKRVADYFVVAGLPDKDPELLEDFSSLSQEPKESSSLLPITDVTVIIRSQGEQVPIGYQCIEVTPTGFPADLNHGGLRTPSIYFCYRRGRDKPPLVDIGVLCEAKERVMADSQVVYTTPYGRPANISNTGSRLFLTYRRAPETAPCNKLVVTNICVILTNKGETPPHAFNKIDKNLNKGMVGSDVFICYKKSMNRPDSLSYKPAVLGRFPLEDYTSFPLPESVALFCLPMGASVECWPLKADQPYPVFSTFVLTSYDAEKVYGSAITFYELYPKEKLTVAQKQELYRNVSGKNENQFEIHANKSICLLSRWPFFDTFEKFLRYLHKMSKTGNHKLPIERYVSHFMLDVPFPSPQRPRILIQLPEDMISLTQPQDTLLPLSGASFIQLLRNLRADNCLMVLLFAMTEQKMLFHSLRPDVLTSVAEAVVMLMFPFHWQCPYIPLCPLGLSDVLSAPLPYIVGVDSRYFDLYDPPTDVICIDLDTNNIYIPDDKKWLSTKVLPKRPGRVLRNALQVLHEKLRHNAISMYAHHGVKSPRGSDMAPYDLDFRMKVNQRELEIEIQEAFLRFMAAILKDFRSYLLPITSAPKAGTTDPSSLFNFQGFVKSRDKAYHRFYMKMMKTQMFTRFIEERSFVSDKDASLAFFDECTEKVDQGGESSDVRLLEFDGSQQTDTTVFIAPPEPPSALGNTTPPPTYSYQSFGTLKTDLFHRHPATCLLKLGAKKNLLASPALLPANSPIGRRTKQEIKLAQKIARKQAETPVMWAKCLLSYSFSLWFIHLPAYVKNSSSKVKALKTANQVLVMMRKLQLRPQDEVCYRVLMLLCGQYSKPVLAVKVLWEMKHNNVQPNAITYGYYNKAVLESQWPSGDFRAADMWAKLRNVIVGVSKFRKAAKDRCRRSQSIGSELDYDDGVSRTSSIDEDVDGVVMRPIKEEAIQGNACLTVEETKDDDFVPDSSKVDDQTSSGGQSDGGYSSMVQDEATNSNLRLSMDVSSELSGPPEEEEATPTPATNGDTSHVSHPLENVTPNSSSSLKNRRPSAARSLKFTELDFTDSDAFRSRVGSIVRISANSLGSLNHLHDAAVDSPAGVLMSSYPAVLEELEIGSKLQQPRRRHKSAGDHRTHPMRLYARSHTTSESEATPQKNRPINEADTSSEILRSNSFGNDDQIIQKLRDEKGGSDPIEYLEQDDTVTIVYKEGSNAEKQPNGGISVVKAINSIFNLASFKEESEAELDEEEEVERINDGKDPLSAVKTPSILPRPRTPNIPVGKPSAESHTPYRKASLIENKARSESPYNDRKTSVSSIDLQADNTFSPLQDAIEFFGTGGLSRMATSFRHSFRWKNSGNNDKSASKNSPNKVTRSSTFHDAQFGRKRSLSHTAAEEVADSTDSNTATDNKTLTRSSTLPHCTEASAMSRFSGNESNVNLSPARFITSSASVAGLSKLASRHTELFEGIKYAANTMATKINEMKQTISASATPTKGVSLSMSKNDLDWLTVCEGEGTSNGPTNGYGTTSATASASASRRTSVDYLSRSLRSEESLTGASFEDPTVIEQMLRESPWQRKGSNGFIHFASFQILQEEVFDFVDKPSSKVALDISLSTLSRCGTCSSLLYDEEIMEGWSADDSNLNTQCTYCKASFVPLMTVKIKDLRINGSRESLLTPAHSQESVRSFSQTAPNSCPTPKPPIIPEMDSPLDVDQSYKNILTPVPVNETPLFMPEIVEKKLPPKDDTINVMKMDSIDSHDNFMLFEDSQFDKRSLPRDSPLDSPQKSPEKDLIDLGNSNGEILAKKTSSSVPINGMSSPPLVITEAVAPFSQQISSDDNNIKNRDTGLKAMFLLGVDTSPIHIEPITVPYLSPLVLRKEVENVLDHEGDDSLTKPEFVDQHPIIYWNLIWYFTRINVPSHLPGLSLRAKSIVGIREIPIAWQKADTRNVSIHCLWDNVRLHEDMGLPMYQLYGQTGTALIHALNPEDKNISKTLMNQILSRIQCNDLLWPINTLIAERQKRKGKNHHGIYRELLFLCLTVLGQDNIDLTAFNREYRKSYDQLTPKQLEVLGVMDRPPTLGAIFCQYHFKPLELKLAS